MVQVVKKGVAGYVDYLLDYCASFALYSLRNPGCSAVRQRTAFGTRGSAVRVRPPRLMAKINYDGVVEAAHFKPDGQLDWVRVYERRFAVFSDRIILRRSEFIKQLKAGKRYMVGERILNMGGKFNVTQSVHLLEKEGKQVIIVGDALTTTDEMMGIPII